MTPRPDSARVVGGMPEDARERADFDRATATVYDGSARLHIAGVLEIWARMAPPQGSYAKTCAIMSNILRAGQLEPSPQSEELP